MKIHFVYAGGQFNTKLYAPFSITRNIANHFQQNYEVRYYEWTSTDIIEDLQHDDIILGHPHYDSNTIMQKMMYDNRPCAGKFLIHPFHHGRVQDNIPFNHLVKLANKIFMICGSYWIDSIDGTVFQSWKDKIVHLNMAVDANEFSFRRSRFNDVGKRRLLYVGSDMPQKNLDLMYEIVSKIPDVELVWYGTGGHRLSGLPNVKAYGWHEINQDLMTEMVNKCDLFINTSISDASPTAMLEAAAVGFPIACTKESGIYNVDGVTTLSLTDVHHNVNVIRDKLNSDLMPDAVKCRHMIDSYHTWPIFLNKLSKELVG